MSENPQYHPVVEELVVTEGQDAGRIKDVEFASEVAYPIHDAWKVEKDITERYPSETPRTKEEWKKGDHEFIAIKIAQKALDEPWKNKNRNELATGIAIGQDLNEIEHNKNKK